MAKTDEQKDAAAKQTSQVSSTSLATQTARFGHALMQYRVVLFVLFVAIIFAIVVWRINSYSDIQPNPEATDSEITSVTPHIDQNVARQLTQLKNNHVSVQTLFQQARQNPFSE